MSGETLLVMEILPIRIYPIIRACAYIEKIIPQYYYFTREIEDFTAYLKKSIPEEDQKVDYYYDNRLTIMMHIVNLHHVYGDTFINRDTQKYIDTFVSKSITRVYTPEFDKKWGKLAYGDQESRTLYKDKKLKYISEESEKYLKYAKKYIRERYKEQKKK